MPTKKNTKAPISTELPLLEKLAKRFEQNLHRHKQLNWEQILHRLQNNPSKLSALEWMENTGGEPDVVFEDVQTGQFWFMDCSNETPAGRRSLCYDEQALAERKEFKPNGSAVGLANMHNVDLLTEEEYYFLQNLQAIDLKTSSWLKTPEEIRKLGGALFGDRRFNRVFTYHNGASSYYGVRGFRVLLKV